MSELNANFLSILTLINKDFNVFFFKIKIELKRIIQLLLLKLLKTEYICFNQYMQIFSIEMLINQKMGFSFQKTTTSQKTTKF